LNFDNSHHAIHHMATPLFNFTSKREAEYRLVPRRRLPPRKPGQSQADRILNAPLFATEPRIVVVGNGGKKRSVQIADHPMLFDEFSRIGATVEHDEPPAYSDEAIQAMLDFVRRYGRLTDEKAGDNVFLLLDEAGEMKRLLRRRKRKPPVQVFDLKATASLDPKTGNIDIRPLPQTLLQALWLQLICFLSGGGELRKCQRPGCPKSFPIGVGTKRTDSKFCSHDCQVLFNSRKRSNPALREKRK
jgi:hypothetical protein